MLQLSGSPGARRDVARSGRGQPESLDAAVKPFHSANRLRFGPLTLGWREGLPNARPAAPGRGPTTRRQLIFSDSAPLRAPHRSFVLPTRTVGGRLSWQVHAAHGMRRRPKSPTPQIPVAARGAQGPTKNFHQIFPGAPHGSLGQVEQGTRPMQLAVLQISAHLTACDGAPQPVLPWCKLMLVLTRGTAPTFATPGERPPQ